MRRPPPSILTSLAFGLVLALVGLTGCRGESVEARARAHAAVRLGVPTAQLRVTERSALSTPRHAVLRVTPRGEVSLAAITVVVPREGGAAFDGTTPGAFTRLMADEDYPRRQDSLGAGRIASWFGALGAGHPCGEPLDDGRLSLVAEQTLAEGARRLSWTFARERDVATCVLELGADGAVHKATASDNPVASAPGSGAAVATE